MLGQSLRAAVKGAPLPRFVESRVNLKAAINIPLSAGAVSGPPAGPREEPRGSAQGPYLYELSVSRLCVAKEQIIPSTDSSFKTLWGGCVERGADSCVESLTGSLATWVLLQLCY